MSSFQFRSSEIFYSIRGEGLPVMLVHGFGEDSEIWNEQIHFLQSFCQVITFDLPGSGKSKTNTALQSIEDYAEAAEALRIHLKLSSIIMLGHSMGGYITLAYAEKYAANLIAFGLIHSTAFADSEEKKETRKKGITFIRKNGAFSFLKTSTPNLFSERSKQTNPLMIDTVIEKGKAFEDEALINYYEIMINRPDRTAVLASSECPVLFILGTEDAAAPMQDVLKQVHLPSTSYVHIIENAGHMSMIEEPNILNSHLEKFIKEV